MLPEVLARRILEVAISEGRCAELLECLFDGGSATVDAITGGLVLVTEMNLRQMAGDDE